MRNWLYRTALGLSLMVPAVALPPPAVAAEAPARAPAYIVVKAFQLKSVARLSFGFDRMADPRLVPIPRGVELHLDADVPFRLNGLPQLKQIESVTERTEDGKRIVAVRFTCDCTVQTSRSGKSYRLDIHEPIAAAALPPSATVAAISPAPVAPPATAVAAVAVSPAAPTPAAVPAPSAIRAVTAPPAVPAATPTPVVPVAATQPPVAAPTAVAVRGFQFKTGAKLSFGIGKLPDPVVRPVDGGVELTLPPGAALNATGLFKPRQIESVDTRADASGQVVQVRFSCNCEIRTYRDGNNFALELKQGPNKPVVAATPAPAAPVAAELNALRDSLTAKVAELNAPSPAAPPVTQQPSGPTTSAAPPVVAQPVVAQPVVAQPVVTQPVATAPRARTRCAPDQTMAGWKGNAPFPARLIALRAELAKANESVSSLAALAEFYVAHGMPAEALAVAEEADPEEATPADMARLNKVADLARLLRGVRIQPDSPLLTQRADCDRTDIPLWRAMAAAVAGDSTQVVRDADQARDVLAHLPPPLPQMLALRLADAAPEDMNTQRAMAAAVRNSEMGGPEEAAGRFLLHARIARLRGDTIEETSFLERAIRTNAIVPSLIARVRLAEIRASKDGAEGAASEAILGDAGRVYRDSPFGQSAAATLAERRLRLGDYAGALAVADARTDGKAGRMSDSVGARLAARVLRKMLVDGTATDLPAAEDRMLLFWHYGAYATPGEKGDDIRVAAARLMLDEGLPEAALDVTRQLSDAVLRSPQGALLRARTEAQAGDPGAALAMLRRLPSEDETRRIAADALVRLGRPVDAAREMEAMTAPADQVRRAHLLYEAKAWEDAAGAYATVLRNPATPKEAKADAADRYALAIAMSGGRPAEDLRGLGGLAGKVLGALPVATASIDPSAPVNALRGALERAGAIEALLPPVPRAQPTKPAPTGRQGT
jgi:hypothetical protein